MNDFKSGNIDEAIKEGPNEANEIICEMIKYGVFNRKSNFNRNGN